MKTERNNAVGHRGEDEAMIRICMIGVSLSRALSIA